MILKSRISRKAQSHNPAQLAQVCNLATPTPEELNTVLAATPVNEVWGVFRKITKQLTQAWYPCRAGPGEAWSCLGEAALVGDAGAHGA